MKFLLLAVLCFLWICLLPSDSGVSIVPSAILIACLLCAVLSTIFGIRNALRPKREPKLLATKHARRKASTHTHKRKSYRK